MVDRSTTSGQPLDSLILSHIADSIVLTDPAGIVIYWNAGATRLFGWTAEEMVGRPLTDRVPAEARAEMAALVASIAAGEEWHGEYQNHRKDGSRVWIDARVRGVLDDDGRIVGLLGLSHDISDRKEAGAARLRREAVRARQHHVLQRIATGADLSSLLSDIVLLVEEQLPGSMCAVMVHDREAGCLRSGAGPSLPLEYHRAVDGVPLGPSVGSCGTAAYRAEPVISADIATDPLWADFKQLALPHGLRSCYSIPIFDSGRPAGRADTSHLLGTFALYRRTVGAPQPEADRVLADAAHIAGVALERERALHALRESEERFRLLVDGVRDYALFLVDPDGVIMTWNSGAERTFGYAAAEAIGAPLSQFSPQDDRDVGPGAPRLPRLGSEGRHEVEGWRVRRDGTCFWATVASTALWRADGTLRGFAVVVRDLTERRRLEDQLRQSQKMEAIGQLAGGIAHDFNNLLTVINGYSELLLDTCAPDDSRREGLEAIRDVGERAASLTSKLLAFSRRAIVEPKVLDLNEVTASTSAMLRRLIGEDVLLVTRFGSGHRGVKIDPGQLEQLLVNLAVNARDAMPQGGQLTIQTASLTVAGGDPAPAIPPGDYVTLAVSDTGSGMSEFVKAHIFEPFFTTKGVGQGTGLGLATVYGIVQQAGGHVAVESEIGRGTTFRLLFPAADEAMASAGALALRDAPRGSETLLLVEDEEQVRRLACRSLEMQGYVVLEASSSDLALQVARAYRGSIHLLLTDVVMPDLGGRALADALRVLRPGLRVLYMSGYTDDAVLRHGVESATDAFLQKPFTPFLLARKVRQVIDGAH